MKNVLKGDIRKLPMTNGKTLEQNLLEQANLLKELIEKHLNEYLNAFSPKKYVRTGRLANSVVVDTKVQVVGNQLRVLVYFNKNAIHRSGFGVWSNGQGKYDDDDDNSVNTALLLNYGYRVKKPVWFRDIEDFGYREGAEFVEKAIVEFNRINPMGIILSNDDIIIG